jgi:hypothetical protein
MPYEVSTTRNPTLSAVLKNSSAINLRWEDPNYYCPTVPFREYIVEMSINNNLWSTAYSTSDASQTFCTITNLNPATYSFRMRQTAGHAEQFSVHSNVANYTINSPVQIKINTSANSTNVGEPLTITAAANGGTNAYTYQWYVNDNPIKGATAASFTYNPTQVESVTIQATAQDTQDTALLPVTSNMLRVNAKDATSPQPTSSINQSPNQEKESTESSNPIITKQSLTIIAALLTLAAAVAAGAILHKTRSNTRHSATKKTSSD